MTPARWYAPVLNNWRGEPWSRRTSLVAAVVCVSFALFNAMLRLTDEDAGPINTTLGVLLALWFGVLAGMFYAHSKFNAPRIAEESGSER